MNKYVIHIILSLLLAFSITFRSFDLVLLSIIILQYYTFSTKLHQRK